jgi:hypothetical protein
MEYKSPRALKARLKPRVRKRLPRRLITTAEVVEERLQRSLNMRIQFLGRCPRLNNDKPRPWRYSLRGRGGRVSAT